MYISKAAAKACVEILKKGICQYVLFKTVHITIKIAPPHSGCFTYRITSHTMRDPKNKHS